MKNFILILQFMTRIPININLKVERENFQKGVAYFPLVGLIVGGLEALVYYMSAKIFSLNIASFFTLVTHIVVTGAIHIDGFGDTIDGIFSGRSKEKILEIMKDSRVGTFGAVGIILLILGRFIAIKEMPFDTAIVAIVLAPIIARTFVTFLMYKRRYAREKEGLGDLFIGVLEKKSFLIALVIGCILTLVIAREHGIILLIVGFVSAILFRNYVEKKIDGVTGDILGAAIELNELIVLLLFTSNLF